MFAYFLETSLHLLKIFTFSGITAFSVCKIMNKPFFNPIVDPATRLCKQIKDYSSIYAESVIVASIAYPYLDNRSHSLIRSASNIAEYALWIELLYYFYHRGLHNSWVYRWVHAKHHENTVVYPVDTVNLGLIDSIGLMVTLVAPIWFVQVDLCEYSTIIYIYLTGAFLSHSEIIVTHHSIHHKEFKVNYCFLFPVFDILFNTYK